MKWVENTGDVFDFLRVTAQFKKRFYTIRYERGDLETNCYLSTTIVGISRDLTYVIKWQIPCELDKDLKEKFSEDFGSTGTLNFMPYGYVPCSEEFLNTFYPRNKYDHYISVFEYEGFIEVGDIIDDNGKNLSNWR